MRAFLRVLVLLPIALLLLAFALGNRQMVTVFLDPANSGDAATQFSAPLCFIVLASLMVGVVIGGSYTWVRQGKHRKRARQASQSSIGLKSENDALRGQIAALRSAPTTVANLPASRATS